MKKLKRKLGFTLIEILTALTILAIAMLSFIPMVISTMRANAFGAQMTHSSELCQDKLEEIKRMNFGATEISSGTYPFTSTPETIDTIYIRSVTVDLIDPDMKMITVSVSWTTGGRPTQNTTYVTVKVNY
ncbi:prepilin-type N-terminal cleavage/methylation domain-containing protein [Thermodesulfobacteriota bacterium]